MRDFPSFFVEKIILLCYFKKRGLIMDLSLMLDNIKLNIRVGMIFKYQDKVLIEIRKDRVGNSVIPGGRVKINELSIDALVRELKEEMGVNICKDKVKYRTTLEYFFTFDGILVHEMHFVYQYLMDETDFQKLQMIKENQDDHITDFIFVNINELDKYNLLPLEVVDLIKE